MCADKFFLDDAELCAKEKKSKTVCEFRVHSTIKKLMLSTQRVCITKEQVLTAAKLAHRKWLLLHPPEPPFVFLQGDAQLSHMIWRTSVTMSRDLWYMRMSGRLFMVRLPLVRNSLELFARIAKRYEAANPKKPPLGRPFGSLDFELRDVAGWRFRGDVVINAEESALIAKLRPGEFWRWRL